MSINWLCFVTEIGPIYARGAAHPTLETPLHAHSPMKRCYTFLLLMLLLEFGGFAAILSGTVPPWILAHRTIFLCSLLGGVGGVVYCFRGLYVNSCAGPGWDPKWIPWYFTRPIVSLVCGAVSYVFLTAGLLVLESKQAPGSTEIGFYALAFIAGLNVDKFVTKLEEVAHATWGISKSRAANRGGEEP